MTPNTLLEDLQYSRRVVAALSERLARLEKTWNDEVVSMRSVIDHYKQSMENDYGDLK